MTRPSLSARVRALVCGLVVCGGVGCLFPAQLSAQPGPQASAQPVQPLALIGERVKALVAGRGGASEPSAGLFDIDIRDEHAVRVEAARIRLMLKAADAVVTVPAEDLARWRARLALDQARLSFYELPAARRATLSEARPTAPAATAGAPASPKAAVTPTDQPANPDPAEAPSEADRLIQAELGRLDAVASAARTLDAQFAEEREVLASRRDAILGWQRRIREADASPAAADAMYEKVRARLRVVRNELDEAFKMPAEGRSEVPRLETMRWAELAPVLEQTAVPARRASVEADLTRLREAERALRSAQLKTMMEEVSSLNQGRLSLLTRLSGEKRAALQSFEATARDQASAELRQLTLIVRYHRHLVSAWLTASKRPGETLGGALFSVAGVLVPWAIMLGLFVAWRGRSGPLLDQWVARQEEADSKTRRPTSSALTTGARFVRAIHQPLQSLLVFALLYSWLPSWFQAIQEVRLVTAVILASLIGGLAVILVDAVFRVKVALTPSADDAIDALRLRSLRLVSRVAVIFWLMRHITGVLVGEGTIYHWVATSAWLAVVPTFALIIHWWRPQIARQVDLLGGKTPFQRWLVSSKSGQQSFLASAAAGVYLAGKAVAQQLSYWIGTFEFTRRAHAYLFRRRLAQVGKQDVGRRLGPLSDQAFDSLDPEHPSPGRVAEGSGVLEALQSYILSHPGGLVAIVGERGAGKSFLVQSLCSAIPQAHVVAVGAARSHQDVFDAILATVGHAPEGGVVVLDGVQALIRPLMGGMASFDALMQDLRAAGGAVTWVMTFDQALWPFVKQSRGIRPLFDEVFRLEPWTELEIATLLRERTAAAGVTPHFDALLSELSALKNPAQRQEALAAQELGYYRLIWDYADGNPATALQVWRESLMQDEQGQVYVHQLVTPDAGLLEGLPDETVFILRAVFQMSPVSPEELRESTRTSASQVASAIGYGTRHGFLTHTDGGVAVTMRWNRAIMLMLERRHMLVSL